MIPPEYLVPYLASNVIAIALVLLALKQPRVTRILFVLIFLAASFFNSYSVITDPIAYLMYGDLTFLDLYRRFIFGFFSQHTQAVVLTIAAGQFCIAGLLASRDRLRKWGVAGGVIFFLAIAPLGIGAAFPCSLLLAAAILLMHRGLNRIRVSH